MAIVEVSIVPLGLSTTQPQRAGGLVLQPLKESGLRIPDRHGHDY